MLFKLLFAPVTLPAAGFGFIMRQLGDLAEKELMDVGRIREELLLLQLKLEEGELTEEQYLVQEKDIMDRLRAARDLQQRRGQ